MANGQFVPADANWLAHHFEAAFWHGMEHPKGPNLEGEVEAFVKENLNGHHAYGRGATDVQRKAAYLLHTLYPHWIVGQADFLTRADLDDLEFQILLEGSGLLYKWLHLALCEIWEEEPGLELDFERIPELRDAEDWERHMMALEAAVGMRGSQRYLPREEDTGEYFRDPVEALWGLAVLVLDQCGLKSLDSMLMVGWPELANAILPCDPTDTQEIKRAVRTPRNTHDQQFRRRERALQRTSHQACAICNGAGD